MLISERTPEELRTRLFTASEIKASPKAVKGLRAGEKRILAQPKSLDMVFWGSPYRESAQLDLGHYRRVKAQKPPCGTMACIAGHIAIALPQLRKELPLKTIKIKGADGKQHTAYKAVFSFPSTTGIRVQQELGLTDGEANSLFTPPSSETGWPEVFMEAYSQARTPKELAYVTANRIESFLEELQ